MDRDTADRWVFSRATNIVAPVLLLAILICAFLGEALSPSPGTMLAGHDARALFYPWLSTLRDQVWDGRPPFWDPVHFSGAPLLANPQVAAAYPPTWLVFVVPISLALSLQAAFHLLLAGTGMFVLVRHLYGDRTAAFIAAVTYTFSGFMGARLYAGHLGVIAVYAWAPWLLQATRWAVRDGRISAAMIAGIPLALAALAGHVVSLLYVAVIWGGFAAALGSTREFDVRRVTRQIIAIGITGSALAAVQLIPFAELALHSSRMSAERFDYVFEMPRRHFITLLVPDFFGDPVRIRYWATLNFEEYFYGVGLLPLMCAPMAWRRGVPFSTYSFALVGTALVLAPGSLSPIYSWAAALIPILRFDRAPARAMVLFTFGACLLVAGGIASGRSEPHASQRSRLVRHAAAVIVLLSILGAAHAAIGVYHAASDSVRDMREIRLGGWIRVGVLAAVLAGAWSWVCRRPHRWFPIITLVALVVVDLWSISRRLVDVAKIEPAPVWRDAAALIEEPGTRVVPWRITFLDENDAALVGLRSTGGYNTTQIARYDALVRNADLRSRAFDVAAARYVIAQEPLDAFAVGNRALELVGQRGSAWVYRRPSALPLVRLVYDLEVIDSAVASRARMEEPSFDPALSAIVSDPQGCRVGPAPASSGRVVVERAVPGQWEIATSTDAPALLVIAENAYPGWRVSLDGAPTPAILAYSTFKAVCVPAGEHRISWQFSPAIPVAGGTVSLVAVAGVAWALRSRHRARR